MADEVTITELTDFEPTRVDGVRAGANGFPLLLIKSTERPECSQCEGSGKIRDGHLKCPKCLGSGKMPKIGDTEKSIVEAGVAPSGSGPTPAEDCPTCSGSGRITDGSIDGKDCPDCGGTGADQARTNPTELGARSGFSGQITEGDPMGREKIDKADMSAADVNDLPDSAFAHIESGGKKDEEGKTTPRSLRHFPIHDAAHVRNALSRASQSPHGEVAMPKIKAAAEKFGIAAKADPTPTIEDITPGSPAWEAKDAETATAAATALMSAAELMRQFGQRESAEVAAGMGNDIYDTGSANAALTYISQALAVVAQLAFHEDMESKKGDDDMEKAGRRLSGKTVAALATVRDHLNNVLGDDDPASKKDDEVDGDSAADKFIESATKATTTTGKDVLDMDEQDLTRIVAETVAATIAASDAAKGKALDDEKASVASAKDEHADSNAKDPKAEDEDLEDEADHEDDDPGSTDAAKAADEAPVSKALEDALTKAVEQGESLKAAVEALREEVEAIKQIAAPSDIVRTRPQDAVTKSEVRDRTEIEIARYEDLARNTPDADLRKGYIEKAKSLRSAVSVSA